MLKRLKIIILLVSFCIAGAVAAADVKIGMITTLSTKAGYLGEEIRDGFRLAMESQGGKLGGVSVELLVEDDGRKPKRGKQIAERYMKRENISSTRPPKVTRLWCVPRSGKPSIDSKHAGDRSC